MENSCSVLSGSAKPWAFLVKLGVELIPSCRVGCLTMRYASVEGYLVLLSYEPYD